MKPKLRFKGFDEDWLTTNIENVLSIGNGRDYKHLNEGDIPVFGTGGLMTYVNEFLHDGETVFIGRKGTIDKPAYYNGKFWTVDTLFYTHNFIGALPLYIYGIFQNIDWLSHNAASGVPSLSKDTIKKIPVIISQNLKEQKAIGEYFRKLDGLIRDMGKEIEKLENLKQASLQKMFPQPGEPVPQLRFKGFSEPWHERQLGHITKMNSGGTPLSSNPEYYNGSIPFLSISDISNSGKYLDSTEKYISELGLVNSSAKLFPGGTLFLAMYASIGKCTISKIDLAISQAILGFELSSYIDKEFLYYTLLISHDALFSLRQTGTQDNLNKNIIDSFIIKMPSIEEQRAIGEYFRNLDNMISAKKMKLEKLRQVKSSCLNLMFV